MPPKLHCEERASQATLSTYQKIRHVYLKSLTSLASRQFFDTMFQPMFTGLSFFLGQQNTDLHIFWWHKVASDLTGSVFNPTPRIQI